MKPIWIVDDDQSIRFVLEKALMRENLPTRSFTHPREVLQALTHVSPEDSPQVLVSDIRMPGGSGLDLLAQVKQRMPGLPVIIMTAYSDLDSAVSAFQGGAFEYLPKPFDPRELAARVRAILRRAATVGDNTQSSESADSFFVGTLRMDIRRRRATLGGAPLELTGAEFRVLQHLAESRGQPVDRRLLTERALGRTLTLYDRSIDTHVSNLRRKLERQGRSGFEIRSVRGTGYELIETESAS